ncbi:TonB-dependent receptor [Haliea sp. E17]|uniref:TonB-dependent receptor n=1 Tax=Haliea sp. E17 TaxID=3401576 RepID=UPI003AAC3EAD
MTRKTTSSGFNQTACSRAVRGVLLPTCATALFASSLAGIVPAAQAQTELALEEVVVTARRREESLQDVPLAVTSLSSDFLQVQNISSIEDLGVHVPTFRVTTASAGTNTPLVAVRGQRPVEVLLTLDPAVPLYFADVVLTPTHGTNLAIYDLQNVQVLKGPQGTLFGRNSTGGAVLLTPQAPSDEFGGYAEVKVGNYNLLQLEGAVDVPAGENLRFRLAGRSVDRDGYQDNVADNALRCKQCYWDEDSWGLRLTMDFTPGDRFYNSTIISYDENDMVPRVNPLAAYNRTGQLPGLYELIHNGGLGALNPILPVFGLPTIPDQPLIDEALARQQARDDWQKIESDYAAREMLENTMIINTTEFEISDDISIKNIFGYRDLDFFFGRDTDGTALPIFGAITSKTSDITTDISGQDVKSEQLSNELQLIGSSFDDDLEWLVGVYWLEMDASQRFETYNLGPNPQWPDADLGYIASVVDPVLGFPLSQIWGLALNGLPAAEDFSTVNTAWSVFGEGNYHLNEQWTFTLGLRQTWDNREFTNRRKTYDGTQCVVTDKNDQPLPLDQCKRTVSEDYSKLTWRAVASYTPSAHQLVYGSVSTGYRAGGFNARGTNNLTLEPFDAETVLNYEVGYKGDWQLGDVAIRTNLALFWQEYDDIQKTQDQTVDGEFFTTIINAAEAEIKGGELELTVLPLDNLLLSLAYSYVDAGYKEWLLPTVVGANPDGSPIVDDYDNSGADFTYIPKNSVSGQVQYTLPLNPDIGDVSLTLSGYWNDKSTSNDEYPRWETFGWTESDLANALATAKVEMDPIWNVNLRWSNILGSNLSGSLWSMNLTDEDNALSGTSVPRQLGLITTSWGAPRTYGATLRYEF